MSAKKRRKHKEKRQKGVFVESEAVETALDEVAHVSLSVADDGRTGVINAAWHGKEYKLHIKVEEVRSE